MMDITQSTYIDYKAADDFLYTPEIGEFGKNIYQTIYFY